MRRGVKVRRVVRRFELWPVAKVAVFFHLLCYLLTMLVLWAAWLLMDRAGTLDKVEKLFTRLGWEQFTINGGVLLRAFLMIGGTFVVINTIATVTLAFFYNMLSSIFGGLVVSVLQEASDAVPVSRREQKRLDRQQRKAEKRRSKADAAEAKSGAKLDAKLDAKSGTKRGPKVDAKGVGGRTPGSGAGSSAAASATASVGSGSNAAAGVEQATTATSN